MNNTIILNDCIKEYNEVNQLKMTESEIFELFTVSQFTKNFELSHDDIENSIVDGSLDGGIDVFLMLINDKTVYNREHLSDFVINSNSTITLFISQAKTSKSFKEDVLDKLYVSLPNIFNLDLSEKDLEERFNNELIEKILTFRELWKLTVRKGANIRIHYSYCCKANEKQANKALKSKIRQIITQTTGIIQGAKVEFDLYSSKELLELYKKSKTSKLEIEFKETPVSVSYHKGQIGFVGVSTISNFYNFINDDENNLRENIFESNIRHYQGTKVDVNKKIRNTLENDFNRDFWWLNNGITIIASKVGQIGKTLTLEDVQIVNGLQTSYTIGKFYSLKKNDNRSILLKIIISEDKETIDKIIEATNSQNPVSPTLLRATDDLQRKIEYFFLTKGYFYDRRKNFYKNQGKPSAKIFSIQSTAQAIHAIKNYSPASARAKPTTLIKTDETYNKIFNKNGNFEAYLNCCLIIKTTNEIIKKDFQADLKSFAKSFSYHISRIIASLLTNKVEYNELDLTKIDITKINIELIKKAYKVLIGIYEEFEKTDTISSINSITKSKKFEDNINYSLIEIIL